MKSVYIYGLFHPVTNEIRYIGKTEMSLEKRFYFHKKEALSKKRNSYKNKWLGSLIDIGIEPEIKLIEVCNTENWIYREQFWINYYKSLGSKLSNATKGGDESPMKNPETAKKVAQSLRGKSPSDVTRKLLSIATTGKNNPNYGNKASDYNKQRTRETCMVYIDQYSLKGKFIKTWPCMRDVYRYFNAHINCSHLSTCSKDSNKMAFGFLWRKHIENPLEYILPYNSKIKKIYQYDLNNKLIKKWNSTIEASSTLGIKRNGIQYVLATKGNRTYNGFRWLYKEISNLPESLNN